jgi:ribosomal protein S18 acetylase RimI-like enzyme
LISYRSFRNSDPPAIADIWRSQPPERGLMQPMSPELFEQFVLSKPYFDRHGLIVAVEEGRPIGFAHGSFGPSDDGQGLSTQLGVTSLVMVRATRQREGIGKELLALSERYLVESGAEVLYAGGIRPLNAFYLGLYGGSELPGVLDSNARAQQLFRSCGYREVDRAAVLHLDLAGFRPPIDRRLNLIRRRTTIRVTEEPPARDWWEACTYGGFERTRFELLLRDPTRVVATADFWPIRPLATSWGVQAMGLVELEVAPDFRRQGYATFLLSEAFRNFQTQSVSLIEVQTMVHNQSALALYQRLGFVEVDQGAVFRKDGPPGVGRREPPAHLGRVEPL